jgi:hypothetical protein
MDELRPLSMRDQNCRPQSSMSLMYINTALATARQWEHIAARASTQTSRSEMSIYSGMTPRGILIMAFASIGALLFVSVTARNDQICDLVRLAMLCSR